MQGMQLQDVHILSICLGDVLFWCTALLTVEIQILSTLEHPNIIKYLGAEFTKTTLRIFLDLASEGSLKDILNEFGECHVLNDHSKLLQFVTC